MLWPSKSQFTRPRSAMGHPTKDSFVHFMQILNENDGFNAEDDHAFVWGLRVEKWRMLSSEEEFCEEGFHHCELDSTV